MGFGEWRNTFASRGRLESAFRKFYCNYVLWIGDTPFAVWGRDHPGDPITIRKDGEWFKYPNRAAFIAGESHGA